MKYREYVESQLHQGEGSELVGWRLVPVDPTPEMLKRGDQGQTPGYIWDAMLAAALSPPLPAGNADPRVREAFEAWERKRYVTALDRNPKGTWGDEAGEKYAAPFVQASWEAWQATFPSPQSQGLEDGLVPDAAFEEACNRLKRAEAERDALKASIQSQGLVDAAEHADQEEIIFQALKKSPLDCRTERAQRLLAAEIHESLRSRASNRSA